MLLLNPVCFKVVCAFAPDILHLSFLSQLAMNYARRARLQKHGAEDQSALPVVLGQSHEPQYDEKMKPTRSDVSADVEQTEV